MALKNNVVLSGQNAFICDEGAIVKGDANEVVSAYIKVEKVSGSKESASMLVSFTSDKLSFNKSYEFVPEMNGDNFIKQGYLHLKKLPEFSGSVDC